MKDVFREIVCLKRIKCNNITIVAQKSVHNCQKREKKFTQKRQKKRPYHRRYRQKDLTAGL